MDLNWIRFGWWRNNFLLFTVSYCLISYQPFYYLLMLTIELINYVLVHQNGLIIVNVIKTNNCKSLGK